MTSSFAEDTILLRYSSVLQESPGNSEVMKIYSRDVTDKLNVSL